MVDILIRPEEALRLILESVPVLSPESRGLTDCVDRVLAEDVAASEDLPPFDNSAMDGFAVRTRDCSQARAEAPVGLRVVETVRAGTLAGAQVRPGEAVRIMTGAPLPGGADAVVMKEATRPDGDGRVGILEEPEPGQHIRRRGEDVRSGDRVLEKGTPLRPYEVALLAAQGLKSVRVVRRPKVSILATGDELVEPSERLSPGRIRNSNGPALAAALGRWGMPAEDRGLVRDDPALLREAFRRALAASDVLLVSGGVSVGDFDYTKALLEELGLRVVFWKAAIKPGKPLLFGLYDEAPGRPPKPVFGLPGNPVSVLVCLEEFVRPALERMQGFSPRHPSYHLEGVLENDYRKEEGRQQYLFCRVSRGPEGFKVRVIRPQGSAMLGMASQANALALGPIGVRLLAKGTKVGFRWLK